MNQVILMGRLVKDPEIRMTKDNEPMKVANYVLAVNDGLKKNGEQDVDFINCVAFGRSAELAEKYLKKGMKMLVRGRIKTGSYTNKDGQKIYTTDVYIESQEFVESKAKAEDTKPGTEENKALEPAAEDTNPETSDPEPKKAGSKRKTSKKTEQ